MITKTKINTDTIQNLDNEKLDELVYNKAVDLYLGTFGENFKDNESDKLLKALFATSVLDSSVKNGGFDSFFSNSIDLIDSVLVGLKLIKADKYIEIYNEAVNIFNTQKEEFIGKRNPNLTTCDDKYYELENLETLRQSFIADNIAKLKD